MRHEVNLYSLIQADKLTGDALLAYQDWIKTGQVEYDFNQIKLSEYSLIIDAILGTGLDRPLKQEWQNIIRNINKYLRAL